jgi:hypothetical protein
MKRFSRQVIADMLAALLVFLLSLALYKGTFREGWDRFAPYALLFYGFHLLVSLAFRKYEYHTPYSLKQLITRYHRSWIISSGTALLTLVLLHITEISRQMILTNLFGLLAAEYVIILFVSLFRESVPLLDPEEIAGEKVIDTSSLKPLPEESTEEEDAWKKAPAFKEVSPEVMRIIRQYCPAVNDEYLVLNSPDNSELLDFPEARFKTIANAYPLNRTRYLSHYLEAANSRLTHEGILLVCAETSQQRKKRIFRKFPPLINRIYYFGDFILMRVIPKLPPFRQIYFNLTRGQSYVMSRTEILGRLSAAGFVIHDEVANNGHFCVAARKAGPPLDIRYATYGPLVHLRRIGKEGKLVKIYKLRTMYPYSEFIQDYVYARNNLGNGGKLRDDFRVTSWGRFLRRHWLDELPGLWNWIRGDVKLVGIRPLSKHYFSLYSPELQQKRVRYKPGLIPPFYYDLPETLEEIQASEMRYLEQYEKAPLRTDFRYFWKALYNILIKGAKSS